MFFRKMCYDIKSFLKSFIRWIVQGKGSVLTLRNFTYSSILLIQKKQFIILSTPFESIDFCEQKDQVNIKIHL